MNWLNQVKVVSYQHVLLYAIALLIPLFPRAVPILIIAFGLLSIYTLIKGFRSAQLTEVSILLMAFYGLHILGMLYTENQGRGWFDLEVKLSLLALPIIFVGFGLLNTTTYRRVLLAFLAGTTLAAVFCMAQSLYKVVVLGYGYWHLYTFRFSVIVHQSYFAMYLIFSLLILTYLSWPKGTKPNKWLTAGRLMLFAFLSVCTLFTGSKIGFIMWLVVVLGIAAALVNVMQQKWIPIAALIVMGSIMGGLFQSSPVLQQRIMRVIQIAQGDKEVTADATESTAVRQLIYSSAWKVATSQPWYGQGTGDFQDALDDVYKRRNYTKAMERHFNAHNLFLQSWISLGIPGLMMTIGIFIVLFQQALASREWLFVGFCLLIFLISLTESMLNMQAGVVFFSFFAIIFSRRT